MFRSSERLRLLSMLGFLAVLAMLYFRARDPATWQWLSSKEQTGGAAAKTGAGEQAAQPDSPAPPADPVAPGPTDEDADQRFEAEQEFQAVTDGTLGVQHEEMFGYWRLFTWVEHQSLEALRQRAQQPLVYNDFVQSPQQCRGRLASLDLHVRRVLAYDAPDSPVGVQRVYEIWGYTDESRGWLFCVVAAHLPEGMPIGPMVYDRATFAGYFFKLQGYHEAGAKPRATPLRAPLLVGRLARYPAAAEQSSAGPDTLAWLAGGGLVALFGGVAAATYVFQRRAARRQRGAWRSEIRFHFRRM